MTALRRSGWLAAVIAFAITVSLVAGELAFRAQRLWWSSHPLTTDTVAGLLVLLLTVLVVNQLLNRQQARQRARAVAGQAVVLVAQARRTASAIAHVETSADNRSTASLEFRTYTMMLLIAAPIFIDTQVARHFLEEAQHAGATMGQMLVRNGPLVPTDGLDESLRRLASAATPLLQPIGPQALDAIQRAVQ